MLYSPLNLGQSAGVFITAAVNDFKIDTAPSDLRPHWGGLREKFQRELRADGASPPVRGIEGAAARKINGL